MIGYCESFVRKINITLQQDIMTIHSHNSPTPAQESPHQLHIDDNFEGRSLKAPSFDLSADTNRPPSNPDSFSDSNQNQAFQLHSFSTKRNASQHQPFQLNQANNTGLPDQLKSGVEQLSGHNLDDVRVQFNSSEPAAVQAHAFARGNEIHVAPGQEQHLPEEAWHVTQQKAGRVKANTEVGGQPVNDQEHLETEARSMGNKAMQLHASGETQAPKSSTTSSAMQRNPVVQRVVLNMDSADKTINEAVEIESARVEAVTGEAPAVAICEPGKELESAPINEENLTEEITVLAHGTPDMGGDEARVAGLTAAEMYGHLLTLGFTTDHTGVINFSNCTSAWDRMGKGSFAEKFVAILKANGHENPVTGFESFTESKSLTEEVEIPHDKREAFLAHKLTERYLMATMNIMEDDDSATIKEVHAGVKKGATLAMIESVEFGAMESEESPKWSKYYASLSGLLMEYLSNAGDAHNGKAIFEFQMKAMELMKSFEIDHMGARIGEKPEAIPSLFFPG